MALSPGLTSASLRAAQPSDTALLAALRRLVCSGPTTFADSNLSRAPADEKCIHNLL